MRERYPDIKTNYEEVKEAAEKLGKASAGANIAHMALELAGKKGER